MLFSPISIKSNDLIKFIDWWFLKFFLSIRMLQHFTIIVVIICFKTTFHHNFIFFGNSLSHRHSLKHFCWVYDNTTFFPINIFWSLSELFNSIHTKKIHGVDWFIRWLLFIMINFSGVPTRGAMHEHSIYICLLSIFL